MPNPIPVQFQGPAQYQIVIQGRLNASWANQFKLIDIEEKQIDDDTYQTSFICYIHDQGTLAGLLSGLYERHITILRVKYLDGNLEKESTDINI